MLRRAFHMLALGAATALALPAAAQDYPSKPVKVIVPFGAGGGTDITTRIWADLIDARLNQRFLVENQAGAAGAIGTKAGIAAPPDGYTLTMGVASTMAINPFAMKDIGYLPTDIEPVAMLVSSPWMMVASAKLPVDTIPELIQYGKDHPGELTFAGWTGTGEIGRKIFEKRTGIELLGVPYPSSVAAMTDLVAGRASVALIDLSAGLEFLKSGEVKVLAITSKDRSPLLPDAPSTGEAGIENYEVASWVALFAPKGTPPEIIEKLNAETTAAMNEPDTVTRLREMGMEPKDWSPEEVKAYIAEEGERWKQMIDETGGPT